MFLHLSVSHSVHRGGRAWQGDVWQGACMMRGMHGWGGGHVWQGGMHGRGVHGGGCIAGGACMVGDMHAMHTTPPPLRDTVDQCAGGTHPTGMHTCLN